MWPILLLFFMSGISGLIYQVVWVREFGTVFGVSVYSAASVSAIFMFGLGVGSFAVGRWSDRLHARNPNSALLAYGAFELAIATLGLLIAFALPNLEAISAAVSSYQPNASGWFVLSFGSHLMRFALATALLAPITFLMGGTLTLLIRHLVSGDLSRAGWQIGALYGINTAGAALGALLTAALLIPRIGIFSTELVAIALNAVAGVGAIGLARSRSSSTAAPEIEASGEPKTQDIDETEGSSRAVAYTSAALFCSGAAAMGMEIVWFRHLISSLGALRAVFSLLLTVILAGIFAGSLLGGYLERRTGKPVLLYIGAQTAFMLATLLLLALYDPRTSAMIDLSHIVRATEAGGLRLALLHEALSLQHILAMVGIPALLLGASFPLGNAHVQRLESRVGSRSGALYLANTLGNVVGSLGTGLLLLPVLGIQASTTLLMLLVALGIVAIHQSLRAQDRGGDEARLAKGILLISLAGFVMALGAWLVLRPDFLLRRTLPAHITKSERAYSKGLLGASEGINETLAVVRETGGKTLYTNGHPMSSTTLSAQRYMRLFAHLPLLNSERPEKTLVICFGVGTTLHATSLHESVGRLEVAELSENVLRHGPLFSDTNGGVLDDPRLHVFANDGRQHLRMQPEASYDLITLEPPPINYAGVAGLYSREFYALARSRLKESGYLTQWLPTYQVPESVVLAIVKAFMDVFPEGVLVSGYDQEFILMGMPGGAVELNLERIRERLARETQVRSDLERVGANSLSDLAATFVASSPTLLAATADVAAVTDDHPIMEYSSRSTLVDNWFPGELVALSDLSSFCPDCFAADTQASEFWALPYLQRVLDAYYQSERFRHYSNVIPRAKLDWGGVRDLLDAEPCIVAALRANASLRRIFHQVLKGRAEASCASMPENRTQP
jgi:spermidine synthase